MSSVKASAVKALQKELKDLSEFPVEGFKARLSFPDDYPYSPPTMHFLSRMYHPNIYENGEVCISILHSPGDDPQSGELPSERTVLLSVISLLNEPNIHSAAHVDASVAYRKWKESNGVEDEYERIVKSLVIATHEEAKKDGITVPTTVEEYCVSGKSSSRAFCHQSGDLDDVFVRRTDAVEFCEIYDL
ncbi:unnamed protein product [Trichobilharzia regenti]|nr:unnamed protein product [Trichobilharzia regenti]